MVFKETGESFVVSYLRGMKRITSLVVVANVFQSDFLRFHLWFWNCVYHTYLYANVANGVGCVGSLDQRTWMLEEGH